MITSRGGRVLLQVGVLVVAFAAYMVLRVVVEGDRAEAVANAELVLDVEAAVGLDWEAGIQDEVLRHPALVTFFNAVYKWLYWPTIAGALFVLALADRQGYFHLRNALFLSAAIGILMFAAFPVAPPRFVGGYVDTLSLRGQRAFEGDSPWTNAYAAVPSFHVGWTALAAVVVGHRLRSRLLAAVVALPALLTTAAVVATGNHWVVDGLIGLAVVTVAYVATREKSATPVTVPSAPDRRRETVTLA